MESRENGLDQVATGEAFDAALHDLRHVGGNPFDVLCILTGKMGVHGCEKEFDPAIKFFLIHRGLLTQLQMWSQGISFVSSLSKKGGLPKVRNFRDMRFPIHLGNLVKHRS